MNTYNEETLKNAIVSFKIDGVNATFDGEKWLSRRDKPLYNLPLDISPGTYEVFFGNWSESISATRTHEGKKIDKGHLYRLDILDERLRFCVSDINKQVADLLLNKAISLGYEGIVITCNGESVKHKPFKTFDERVIDWQAGTGKHLNRMGALWTEKGKVGTGFTDIEREKFTREFILFKIIEVKCSSLTPEGKFREPRFLRLREDK